LKLKQGSGGSPIRLTHCPESRLHPAGLLE
jgi:hypothetical protein